MYQTANPIKSSHSNMMMNCVLFVMISLVAADVSCKTKCCKIENGKPQKEFEEITDILSKLTQAFMVEGPQVNNSAIMEVIFKNVSATCRRYTDVMAFKGQFQKQLFNNATQHDIMLLTSLIISLQTAAMKLQKIEIALAKRYCVQFTSEQYELIYFARLHTEKSLVRSLQIRNGIHWQNQTELCLRWDPYE